MEWGEAAKILLDFACGLKFMNAGDGGGGGDWKLFITWLESEIDEVDGVKELVAIGGGTNMFDATVGCDNWNVWEANAGAPALKVVGTMFVSKTFLFNAPLAE